MRRAVLALALSLACSEGGAAFAGESPAPAHRPRPHGLPVAPAAPVEILRSTGGRGRHAIHGVVNINQADQAALELLPGVGEVTAQRILVQRKAHPFRRVDDITKVKGIGRKKLARMRSFLAVSGPTTIAEDDPAPRAAEAAEAEGAPAPGP
jgi:competence protein ComEA